jgi:UDP-N-acetylmuramoyl-tripeptide--D-alanyl-D-alanine ligase
LSGLNLTLAETALAVNARKKKGLPEVRFSGVSTDTRTIRPGDLFVPIRGDQFDGHDFINQAFDKGAAATLAEPGTQVPRGRRVIRVADTLQALGDLASHIRHRQKLKVVAVTGSNGKTTTKEMIRRILDRKYEVLATEGNFNNLVGLPLTLFRLRPEHEVAVLEMGMNRPGEITRLTEIADPDLGLITNVAPAHLEGLGSVDGVARAKGELFRGLGPESIGAVNADDPLVMREARYLGGRSISFGFNRKADVSVRSLSRSGLSGLRFDLVYPQGRAPVKFALLGEHNVRNALAAASVCWSLGLSPARIASALDGFRPFPGRLELKKIKRSIYLLDDTYNANPGSTLAALDVLTNIRGKGRAIAVLGDMLELGDYSRREHRRVGRNAAEMGADIVIGVGKESQALIRAARKISSKAAAKWFKDTASAAKWLKSQLRPHDRVLIKGSRGMRMENVVKALTNGEAG